MDKPGGTVAQERLTASKIFTVSTDLSLVRGKIYSQYRSLPRQRQNMNSLHNLILKVQKQVTPRMVAPHIKKLPAVMKLIIEKKGGPTGK